jgi:hypothetical protein
MPHGDHPDSFVEVITNFIDSTEPYQSNPELVRKALQTGVAQSAEYVAADVASDLA